MCNNLPCVLDFEQEKVVSVKAKVTDSGNPTLTFEKTIPITVNDVNDPPVVDIAGSSIPENSPSDSVIGKNFVDWLMFP